MTTRSKRWNGDAMKVDGCIVSFEAEDGSELTLHRTGPLREGLRDACRDALAVDPTMRVVCYSTPTTVADDLGGYRMDHDAASGYRADPVRPEPVILAQVGLLHLIHPRLLVSATNDAVQRRRAKAREDAL